MRSRIHTWGWDTLDFLFPPRCAGCNKWGERYCASCQEQTKLIGSSICQVCGEPYPGTFRHVCQRCQTEELYYSSLRSWAYFEGPIQRAIHKLKYKKDLGLGEKLAQPLVNLMLATNWDVDLITAVPLDEARQSRQGIQPIFVFSSAVSLGNRAADCCLNNKKDQKNKIASGAIT